LKQLTYCIQDLSSRLGSILEPQSARSVPDKAAAQSAVGTAANAWDGHVHVALVVHDQGHVQLKMQAEPVPASSAAAASSTSSLPSSPQSESRGLKPESAQGKILQLQGCSAAVCLCTLIHTLFAAT